jgi:hypothetical protein
MSIFGGGEILVVHSTVSKLMEEYPELLKDAVITAVMADEEISNYILLTYLHGFRGMARKFYNYGKSRYYFELPSTSTNAVDTSGDPTREAIASELGLTGPDIKISALSITEVRYADATAFAYEYLQENYSGYNAAENRFYFGNLNSWYELTKVTVIVQNPDDLIKMKCTKVSGPGDEEIVFYEYAPKWENIHYLVQYYLAADDPKILYYWSYDTTLQPGDEGYHPNMGSNSTLFSESYFPIVPVRYNKGFINDPESKWYDADIHTSCDKILRKVNVNLDEITDAMAENESIDKIDDAYFMFGIDIYTEEKNSLKYLFDHFMNLKEKAWIVNEAQYLAGVDALSPPDPLTNMGGKFNIEVNSLSIKEQHLWIKISFNYAEVQTVTGTLEKPYEIAYTPGEPIMHNILTDWQSGSTIDVPQETNFVEFKRKIDDSSYEKLTVHGLTHITYVILVDDMKEIFRRIEDADPDWEDNGKPADPRDGFFIPVDREVAKKFIGLNEDYLLYESMILVVIAAEEQELKWYQTGFWSGIITFVIMIAAIYFTGGAAANLAKMTAAQAVKALAANIAIGYVANLLAKKIGGVLGIVAAIAVMYFSKGLLKGGFSNPMNMTAADLAKEFISIVNTVFKLSVQDRSRMLQDEYDELMEERERLEAEQQELYDLQYPNGMYQTDLLGSIMAPRPLSPYESVEAMYNRAIHTGNPGVLTLDFIKEFVDHALKLPEHVYGQDDKSITGV